MTDLWQTILSHLEIEISPASFKIWFSKTKLIDNHQSSNQITLNIACPSSFVQDTIEQRFLPKLEKIGQQITSKRVTFVFTVSNQSTAPKTKKLFTPLPLGRSTTKTIGLNPRYTFENFVVGPTNQVAVAAAQTIAQSPGQTYNPFFLFGDVGLGKTHLIQAIAHHILDHNPKAKILYTTSEDFTNDLIRGLRSQKMEFYKTKYRQVDVLLIDDIQFIAGKTFVQEEFFHTFNSLYMNGKQVIVTADSPPDEINGLPQRIISRFKGGLTIDVQPLDYETRRGIIEHKINELRIEINDEIVDILSNQPYRNAREIEGILLKIKSLINLSPRPPDPTKLFSLLNNHTNHHPNFNHKQIISKTADYWGIKSRDILSKSRRYPIVVARQIAMYLCRQELNLPYNQIGFIFGGKDHSTVMHSVEKIAKKFKNDPKIKEAIISIKSNLWR